MDPGGAFRWHCAILGTGLIVSAWFTPGTALLIACAVVASGVIAAACYYVPIATASRKPWRKRRDRSALIAWLLIAGCGPVAASVVFADTTHASLAHHSHKLAVMLIGFLAGGLAGIVISGIIDWYLVLPRLAGMLGEPPCRSSLAPRWKYVTIGWYLHRGLAAIATIAGAAGGIVAIALFIFGHVDEFTIGEILTVVGLIAAGYKFRLPTVATLILNPKVQVGDAVLHRAFDGPPAGAFVVDVSVEGVKVKHTTDASGHPTFQRKESATVPINKIDEYLQRQSSPYAGCLLSPDGCSGINWYCKNNPHPS